MTHLGFTTNHRGTRVSSHRCETCGKPFTCCPAREPDAKGWENCLAEACDSYDIDRDIGLMWDSMTEHGGLIHREETSDD